MSAILFSVVMIVLLFNFINVSFLFPVGEGGEGTRGERDGLFFKSVCERRRL